MSHEHKPSEVERDRELSHQHGHFINPDFERQYEAMLKDRQDSNGPSVDWNFNCERIIGGVVHRLGGTAQ